MGVWIIWLIVACGFGVGEMHQGGFYLAPFAGGALVAALAGLLGAGGAFTAVVFLVVSILAYAAMRPLARRHRHLPPSLRTGAAALVGRRAIVLERIVNDEGVGCVRVDGEVWTARSYDEDAVLEPGQRVEIVEIRGATALVL